MSSSKFDFEIRQKSQDAGVERRASFTLSIDEGCAGVLQDGVAVAIPDLPPIPESLEVVSRQFPEFFEIKPGIENHIRCDDILKLLLPKVLWTAGFAENRDGYLSPSHETDWDDDYHDWPFEDGYRLQVNDETWGMVAGYFMDESFDWFGHKALLHVGLGEVASMTSGPNYEEFIQLNEELAITLFSPDEMPVEIHDCVLTNSDPTLQAQYIVKWLEMTSFAVDFSVYELPHRNRTLLNAVAAMLKLGVDEYALPSLVAIEPDVPDSAWPEEFFYFQEFIVSLNIEASLREALETEIRRVRPDLPVFWRPGDQTS